MHSATDFLLRHGSIVVFVAVFMEQIGLPIPSGPVLLAAGALAGFQRLNLVTVLVLSLAASLVCDSVWFCLGRWRGGSVLKFVCRVSIEPDTCVSKTHSAYLRYGPKSLVLSKFLPWFGTLGPPLAGMFNLAVGSFSSSTPPALCCGRERMWDVAGCFAGNWKMWPPLCPDSVQRLESLWARA